MTTICRIARFSLTTAGADRLGAFYERALGFRRMTLERHSGVEFESVMGVAGGATALVLGLGEQVVELLEFATPGRPYPGRAASSDLTFQHLAIVVADMRAAYEQLIAVTGWSAITSGGPRRLPEASGGVTAFKFRDPDGHPLELLGFPEGKKPPPWRDKNGAAGPCLGIDHSAISVSDTARSTAFYQALGFTVSSRSHNHGPEQARLDALPAPDVEVTGLSPGQATPHIELLCYRSSTRDDGVHLCNNDIAASRLVLEVSPSPQPAGMVRRGLFDPDGHHLLIDEPAEPSAHGAAP